MYYLPEADLVLFLGRGRYSEICRTVLWNFLTLCLKINLPCGISCLSEYVSFLLKNRKKIRAIPVAVTKGQQTEGQERISCLSYCKELLKAAACKALINS